MSINRLILDVLLIFRDISQTRAAGPAQPILKTFPRTQHGQGGTRAFSDSWYKDSNWVDYSQCQDSAFFFFACRHFWLPSVQETQLLAFEIGKRPCRKMEVSASMLEQSSILMPWWHGGVLITIHLYSRQWTKGTKNRKYMKTVADV